MQEERARSLTPPGELRPAQLGIVLLGRVILGHISATLIDLAQRGFLRIDEVPGDDLDWLLTDLRGQAAGRSALLRFEATLLDGLFARQSAVRLSGIGQALIPVLNRSGRSLAVTRSGMAGCVSGTGISARRVASSYSRRSRSSGGNCAR